MPTQSIYLSQHAPPTPQHNRFPPAGTFVQKFENLPRALRRPQFGNQNQYDRADPRDDARMGSAHLRTLQQTLDNERKAHKVELDRIEVRARHRYETALQEIINDILGQRAALVQQKIHLKEWELGLNAREGLTRKIEHLLAEGQRQFAGAEADEQGLEPFINVNEEIIRERVIHEIGRRDRKVDAQLTIKKEKLDNREAAIDMREKAYSAMYKVQVAEKLESRIRAELEEAITARESTEYDRGLAEGKALGQAEGNEELRQIWHDKGFATCHSISDRMKRFQAGLLAHDSPEMAFLFDESHPDNPFTRGLKMGRRDVAASSQQSPAWSEPDGPMPSGLVSRLDSTTANGNAADTPARSHPYAHLNGRTNGHAIGHDNGHEDGVGNSAPIREQGGPVRGLPNSFSTPTEFHPHPFAYANGHTNGHTNGANSTPPHSSIPQNGVENHSTPLSRADPTFGVPQFGPRSAPRPIHPSLQSQAPPPQTPTTNGALTNGSDTTGDRADSSVARANGEVPTFLSGRRLLTYGRAAGEDERVHKADIQVDLIDLY
ncbi:hypothetical protein P171DRAFT_430745 [Karstenula rhodostoma CBS 690.94]|uniref:Uncharacterized protein n=1 Tax=Karstenula rhodostoma CBS 690.94 TaxID=1392251 RepID=A0A9P4PPP5_9PLEO|nr:hypothetical protein P171DRAFT_430745 [Karstenula rhodostoma CBS 690.94]